MELVETGLITIKPRQMNLKEKGSFRYWIGGLFFGLGWALTGACPGPIYSLIGARNLPYVIVFSAAAFGAVLYDFLKSKLPQ